MLGQRSNQLNYVPTLFSYLCRKPACLVAFLRFKRFACIACFNPVEPNSEVNGHHGHQAQPLSKKLLQATRRQRLLRKTLLASHAHPRSSNSLNIKHLERSVHAPPSGVVELRGAVSNCASSPI